MLNQTNVNHNNNKYYVIQLLEDGGKYYVWNRWGRVGEVRENQKVLKGPMNLPAAEKEFKKKFKEKSANNWENRDHFVTKSGKYTLLEMSYSEDEEEKIVKEVAAKTGKKAVIKNCTLPKETQDFIKLIFDNDMFKETLKNFNIDVKKMPLGKISKNQLQKGFNVLDRIQAVLNKEKKGNLAELTGEFFTEIPHDFKRSRPPVIDDQEKLQQKLDLLEVLGDIVVAQNLLKEGEGEEDLEVVAHPLDVNYNKLNNEIELVEKDSDEWKWIKTYTNNTMGMRKVELMEAWRVNRDGELERFKQHKALKNRKLLWHGTNVAVIVAILKGGLRIMPHSGGRVGRGLYFASENGKSSAYVGCVEENKKNIGFMFLNEIALGKEHSIVSDDSSLRTPPPGFDSIVARGKMEPDPTKDIKIDGQFGEVVVPLGKPLDRKEYSHSSFFNSEYLIYSESQCLTRYLLKLTFSY